MMESLRDGQNAIEYVVRDRQEGKTSRLIEWLRGGEPINSALGWSRVLVVEKEQRRQYVLRSLRSRNQPTIQEGQIITLRMLNYAGLRGGFDETEFALDDADELLRTEMPRFWHRVRMVTVNGTTREQEIAVLQWAQEHPEEIEERIAALREQVRHLGNPGEQDALLPPAYPVTGAYPPFAQRENLRGLYME